VSFAVNIPKGTMVGTVLTTAIKAVFVGALVRVGQLVVEPVMRVITVVFVIVSKGRHHRYAHQEHRSHQKRFPQGHDLSPFAVRAHRGQPPWLSFRMENLRELV
jgi:hypothetical protein